MNYLELKKLRKDLGITQAEFAKRVGCAQQQVCKWERRVYQLTDKRLAKFYRIFSKNKGKVNENMQ